MKVVLTDTVLVQGFERHEGDEVDVPDYMAESLLEQELAQEPKAKTKANGGRGKQKGETVEGAEGNPVFVPKGVTLGETPGWPVDENGKPLELTDEQRAELAKTASAS